jgi:glycosyltransferase involved in cell wall biosynthesis
MRSPVSAIIPVHDGAAYLPADLDSVLGQSVPPAEVIVVDDGSTDGTADLLAAYAGRITVRRQAHAGTSAALNHGTRVATGELLAFLDADDLWTREKTAIQFAVLRREPGVDAVFGHAQPFLSEDLPPGLRARLRCPAAPQPGVVRGTLLIRRAAFDRVGPFDESLKAVDFIDWYARALERRLGVRMLAEVVLRRRLHAANGGRRRRAQQIAENLAVLKRALDRRRAGT